MRIKQKIKRRRPTSLRSQIKKYKRVSSEAEILKRLPTMDLAELAKLVGDPSPSVSSTAREIIEERMGLPWKQAIQQCRTMKRLDEKKIAFDVRDKKRQEKQAEVDALIRRYQRLTIVELEQLLANGGGNARAIRDLIKEKKMAQDGLTRTKPTDPPRMRRKGSRSRRRLAEPYSGSDYMKPISEEFDMPEYDLE